MIGGYERAVHMLGFRQRSYQGVFGEGTQGQLVLVDLAVYCRAFLPDPDDISKDTLMAMHGRRQVYFRIIDHLKLSPIEIEGVYRGALMRAAGRLQPAAQEGDE